MIGFFEKEDFQRIAKFIPTYFIFLGCLKLYLFYQSFNVEIVEYLEITEVLVSFFDSIVTLVITVAIPIFLLMSFFGNDMAKSNEEKFNERKNSTFLTRQKSYVYYYILIIIFIIPLFWVKSDFFKLQSLSGIAIFSYLILHYEIRIAYLKQYNYEIPFTYLNTAVIIYFALVVTTKDLYYDVQKIKSDLKYYGTEIKLEKETIKSDSTITYVGQTNNYLFMYNLKTGESISYPRSKVEYLKLKKK